MQKIINSPEDMFDLWKELAATSKILLLHGELWAGKTTLIKGFAAGLGINADEVTSPTYTYIQEYNKKLLHIDMYNIKTYDELLHKWILDLIDQYQLIVIEWPKFVEQLDLEDPTTIFITKKDSSTRELSIV